MYVDDIGEAGKKQNINPTWKVLMKDVDLGVPTSFFDHTQRECHISKDIADNDRNMFESRISAGAQEKPSETRASGKLDANTIKCVRAWLVWQPSEHEDIAS